MPSRWRHCHLEYLCARRSTIKQAPALYPTLSLALYYRKSRFPFLVQPLGTGVLSLSMFLVPFY